MISKIAIYIAKAMRLKTTIVVSSIFFDLF